MLESAFAELGTGSRKGSEIRDIVELVCKKETEGIRREKDRGKEKKKKQRIKHYSNHDLQIKEPR